MLIVIGVVFAVLLYRLAVVGALYRAVQNLNGGPSAADFVVLITGSLIQLVAILVMNKVSKFLYISPVYSVYKVCTFYKQLYQYFAVELTKWGKLVIIYVRQSKILRITCDNN